MEFYEYTNTGGREENQDFYLSAKLSEDTSVFIVADGMGGYSGGAIASKTVAESIFEYISSNFEKIYPKKLLLNALAFANDALMMKRMSLAVKNMGCVITVLLIHKKYAHITWLGDSRIYMYRKNTEVYRTVDHSMLNEILKQKQLDAEMCAKYASVVTKSIMGTEALDEAPVVKIKIEEGDNFVLCSDGFYKELDMDLALSYNGTQKELLDSYSQRVSDNYTFIRVVV